MALCLTSVALTPFYLVSLLLSSAYSEGSTCYDPVDRINTSCPRESHCWNESRNETLIVWSLYNQCDVCLFAQQKPVVVQETDQSVAFMNDGSFQRNQNIEIWKVASMNDMRHCRLDIRSTLVGRLNPFPFNADLSPSFINPYSLNVERFLTAGPNYFVLFDEDGVGDLSLPTGCEQGGRMIIHLGQLECRGTSNLLCSGRGACVFDSNMFIFACRCPDGYVGRFCEEIDQCSNNTACGDPSFEGLCVDGDCNFTCNCFGGRGSLDGQACDSTIPTDCDSDPCLNSGTCQVNPNLGLAQCNCLPGFDSFRFCANIDECESNPCHNDGTCMDGVDKYTCVCHSGFTGTNCEINEDECSVSPCLHSGVCVDGEADVTCTCSSHWRGKFCQIHEDDCITANCMNGGMCIDGRMAYNCLCTAGYTGVVCELEINECVSMPCQNEGTCIDIINGYKCHCRLGFTGSLCEINIDDCASNLCRNGGTCLDHVNKYTCQCKVTFTGSHCENSVDECAVISCQNNGSCVELFDGFDCVCMSGYSGDLCQDNVNECNSNPCRNGGTCRDLISGYQCTCLPFYTGTQCGSRVKSCEFTDCKNGGSCVSIANDIDPVCVCSWGYTGSLCEDDIDVTVPSFGHPLDSYLQVRGDVVNVTDHGISMVMRSTVTDGLVFITSSMSDASDEFVVLYLNGGRLDYRMKIGSRRMRVVSPDVVPMCPWVVVDLKYNGELHVDGQLVASSTPPGTFANILPQYTYLGGVPNPETITATTGTSSTGFVGCVRTLSISGKKIDIKGRDVISSRNVGQCPTDPCTNIPCANDGVCEDTGPLVTDFNCTCMDGFSGDTCDVFNPCDTEPCLHGGLCVLDDKSSVGYRCVCTALFTGLQCATPKQISLSNMEFFGDSRSVWVISSDLRSETVLTLTVIPRVDRSSGILACIGQASTDFLAVFVDNGFVKASLDLGGLRPLVLTSRNRLVAGQQSIIEVQRNDRNVQLRIVGDKIVVGSYQPNFFHLDVSNRLYIGGVPTSLLDSSQKSTLGVTTGFNGCVGNVSINQHLLDSADLFSSYNVTSCDVDVCSMLSPCKNNGTCWERGSSVVCECPEEYQGLACEMPFDLCSMRGCASGSTCIVMANRAVCLCPLGRQGILCDIGLEVETAKFRDSLSSFITFSPLPLKARQSTLISMSIRPEFASGLLLYTDHNPTRASTDFLAIGLYDGYVELRYNLGSGTAVIRSAEKVSLNEWHTIVAARTEQSGTLVLDDRPPVTGSSPGSAVSLNVNSELFLGGLDHFSQVDEDVGLTSGFSGCITDISINSVDYDVSISNLAVGSQNYDQRGRSISNCQDHPCADINCQNGGTCSNANDLGTYRCTCPGGFVDEFCQTEIVNPCLQMNGGCHSDSTCVFNLALQTKKCQCPLTPIARTGEFCNQVGQLAIPKFRGDSFLEFNVPLVNTRQTSIAFNVSSQGTDGLILFMQSAVVEVTDFLAVGMRNGFIEFRIDLGGGLFHIASNVNITAPSSYHAVMITRNSQLVTVTVDDDTVSGMAPGANVGLDVGSVLFVGGIRVVTSDANEYQSILDGVYSTGLIGCLHQLEVDGVSLDVATGARNGLNVDNCEH